MFNGGFSVKISFVKEYFQKSKELEAAVARIGALEKESAALLERYEAADAEKIAELKRKSNAMERIRRNAARRVTDSQMKERAAQEESQQLRDQMAKRENVEADLRTRIHAYHEVMTKEKEDLKEENTRLKWMLQVRERRDGQMV